MGDLSAGVLSEQDTEALWGVALQFNALAAAECERARERVEALEPPWGL